MSATQKKPASTKASTKNGSKKAPAKKSPSKKPAPKKAPAKKADANDAGRSLGATLVKLIARAEEKEAANAKVKAIGEKLSGGEAVKHADLITLRDEVNATAATLREKDQASLAREFSVANRLVRRLERSAR